MSILGPIGKLMGLSPGERAALRQFLDERRIAAHHRQGLRAIRRKSLQRPVRLNLGSGDRPKQGFLNVDVLPGGDVTLDLRRGLLPFESNACELVFSEHCFEHFDYPDPISPLLRECLRILKPGGTLKFSVPDTAWPLTDYRDGPRAPYFVACETHRWHPKSCTTRMEHINFHFRQEQEHRYAYDIETAEKLLKTTGFVEVKTREFENGLDSESRRVGSLFMSARKPD